RRGLQGATITTSISGPRLTDRIAFRLPVAGHDPAELVGRRVGSLTLDGHELVRPGLVIASATPAEDGETLWVVAERYENTR
ncbi:hypothetical protein, partial [Streptomyces cuspidosporus]